MSGVTYSISTQLNNQQSLISALQSSVTSCAPKASPTFTGTVTIPGATSTGIISFPTTMTLATDISAARLILWPGTGNDWYGFGMNGGTLNYNVTTGAVHKFYCSSTVCAIISSATTTFNNNVTCGSNSLTCGTLTCTGGTMGGNTIATTNQLPNLTGYLKQATTLTPVYYNTGRCISLGCDSANNSYLDFHCVDAATTSQADVRIQARGGSTGSNFTSALSCYGSNFYFNGGVNTSTYSITCGGLTINDSSYGNTKLSITNVANTAAYTYSPSYICIGQAVGGYGAAIGGGIRQNEGGVLTLHSVNGGVYTETFRTCWDITMINTKLYMGSNTIECSQSYSLWCIDM